MSRFDTAHMISYYRSVVTVAVRPKTIILQHHIYIQDQYVSDTTLYSGCLSVSNVHCMVNPGREI